MAKQSANTGTMKSPTKTKNYSRRNNPPGRRLDPIPSAKSVPATSGLSEYNNKQKKVISKKDLADVLRKISQMPLPTQTLKNKTKDAPEIVDATTTEVSNLRSTVALTAKKYNETKLSADEKARHLADLLDTVVDLKRETKSLQEMSNNKTWGTQQITNLHKDIHNIEKHTEESLFYRYKLEFMHKRLLSNQKAMEVHLAELESAVHKREDEYQQLQGMMRELEAVKNALLVQIQDKKIEMARNVKVRVKTLENRAQEAANAAKMEAWRSERGSMKHTLRAEIAGDMTKEDEDRLLIKISTWQVEIDNIKNTLDFEESTAATLGNAFQRIKQASGIQNLSEMVEKFVSQENTKSHLESEKSKTERKLSTLSKVKLTLEEDYSLLKAQGIGSTEYSRELFESKSHDIQDVQAKERVCDATVERLHNILFGVRQATLGLEDRLAPLKYMLSPSERKELRKHRTNIQSLDILNKCQQIFTKLMEHTTEKATANSSASSNSPNRRQSVIPEVEDIVKFDKNQPLEYIHQNNIRVTSKSVDDPAITKSIGSISNRNNDVSQVVEDGANEVGSTGSGNNLDAKNSNNNNNANTSNGSKAVVDNDVYASRIWDRKYLKKMSKKVVEQERKKKEIKNRHKEKAVSENKTLQAVNPHTLKRQQQLASQRLLTAGTRHKPRANDDDVAALDAMFVTQLPVLL